MQTILSVKSLNFSPKSPSYSQCNNTTSAKSNGITLNITTLDKTLILIPSAPVTLLTFHGETFPLYFPHSVHWGITTSSSPRSVKNFTLLFFCPSPVFRQWTPIISKFFMFYPIPSSKSNKFSVKISKIKFLVMTKKIFLFIIFFLSLNISNLSHLLCKNYNTP